VEVTDPFSRIGIKGDIDAPALQRRASEFAVALGLAIRRPGDK
jgi:Tfp pilus assembly PilM family ATPase